MDSFPIQQDRLDSWKQVAAYLGRSERTVRRWHQIEGLPVHRHLHQERGSVWAYAHELDQWLSQRSLSPAPLHDAPPAKPWTAVSALGLVLLAFGILSGRKPAQAPLPEPVPIASVAGPDYGAAFSPDGRQLAFHWAGVDGTSAGIYVKNEGSATPTPLVTASAAHSELVYNPAWSPDGSTIAYLHRTSDLETWLCLISPTGGQARRLARIARKTLFRANNLHLAWTPDGSWIISPMADDEQSPRGIYRLSADRGEPRLVVQGHIIAPVISPDGRALAYLRRGNSTEAEFDEVIRQDLKEDWTVAGPPELLFHGSTMTSGLAWAPSGRELILCNADETAYYAPQKSQLFRLPAHPGGKPVPLGVKNCNTVAVSKPDAQGRARLVYGSSSGGKTQLWHASLLELNRMTPFAPSSRSDAYPRYSPDGAMVAFISTRSGETDIWVARRDGSEPRRLTENSRARSMPRWSPDGTRILFGGVPQVGSTLINAVFTLGIPSGIPSRLPLNVQSAWDPLWSPEGDWIIYSSGRQVWRSRPDGSDGVLLSPPLNAFRPFEISPDGQTLYFTRTGRPYSLWKLSIHGGEPELVQEGLRMTIFAVTRKYIYFKSFSDSQLYRMPFSGGPPLRVGAMPGVAGPPLTNGIYGFTVSPDDSEIVLALSDKPELDLQLIRDFK